MVKRRRARSGGLRGTEPKPLTFRLVCSRGGAGSWSEAEPAHYGMDGSGQELPVVPGAEELYSRQMSSALDPSRTFWGKRVKFLKVPKWIARGGQYAIPPSRQLP